MAVEKYRCGTYYLEENWFQCLIIYHTNLKKTEKWIALKHHYSNQHFRQAARYE